MSIRMLKAAVAGLILSVSGFANAGLIDVSTDVTGTAGNWLLDISVTNNLGGTNDLYFFGVRIDDASFNSGPGSDRGIWDNSGYSGKVNDIYDVSWIGFSISPGDTLSGFKVSVQSLAAPTEFDWFAYASGGTYTGDEFYNSRTNPGFDNSITTSTEPVPEPSTLAIFALGMMGLASRKFNKKS